MRGCQPQRVRTAVAPSRWSPTREKDQSLGKAIDPGLNRRRVRSRSVLVHSNPTASLVEEEEEEEWQPLAEKQNGAAGKPSSVKHRPSLDSAENPLMLPPSASPNLLPSTMYHVAGWREGARGEGHTRAALM